MDRRRPTKRTVPISNKLLVIACVALLWGLGIGSERREGGEGYELGYEFGCFCTKRESDGTTWNGVSVLIAIDQVLKHFKM